MGENARGRELAQIHIAKKDLQLDDDTYRTMLWTVARVRSAAELDAAGRARVLTHLKACGFRPRRRGRARPRNLTGANPSAPLLKRIEALLAEAGRPWEYADEIARRMFGVDRLELCGPDRLHKVVGALMREARRHRRTVC